MTTVNADGVEIEIEEEIINTKLNLQALANVLMAKKIITPEDFNLAKKKVSDEFKEKHNLK